MRSFLVSLFLVFFCVSAVVAVTTNTDIAILKKFVEFETKFSKTYASPAERFHRLSVFAENLEIVRKMNIEHGTPVFGVTKFMDLTAAEFKAKYLTLVAPEVLPEAPIVESVKEVSATTFDWGINKTGIITPVKNQEQCGSCWAFSATESIEAAWGLAGHPQVVLSPQQIVDCDTQGSDEGCNGGYPYDAFKYVIGAGGQEPAAVYPYKAVQGKCQFQPSRVAANITSWVWVSKSAATENTAMLSYVANTGPVSVCVDAAPWQYYTGGVLKKCGTSIDHAVQATGFSVQGGVNVWNVRNSWGADWGENGYIWLERGVNLCQIATIVTAAVA